jgi:hypothetical protein
MSSFVAISFALVISAATAVLTDATPVAQVGTTVITFGKIRCDSQMYGTLFCKQLEQQALSTRIIAAVDEFAAARYNLSVSDNDILRETPEYLRSPAGIHERAETMRILAAAALRVRHGEPVQKVYEDMLSDKGLSKRGLTHAMISQKSFEVVVKGAHSDEDVRKMLQANTDAAIAAQVKRVARADALRKAVDREIEARAAATKRSKQEIWAELVKASDARILAGPYELPSAYGRLR